MRIQYISDLHLDNSENLKFFESNKIVAEADILFLVGDVIPLKDIRLIDCFLDTLSEDFDKVYWLLGNHELYGLDYSNYRLNYLENIRDNIFLINNNSIIIEGIEFVFSTLWSHISSATRWYNQVYINDFKFIQFKGKPIDFYDYNSFHEECRQFLTARLSDYSSQKKVVITHHCPILLPREVLSVDNPLIESYCNDLGELIRYGYPDVWIYGHTHANIGSVHIGATSCITNQFVSTKDTFNNIATFIIDF